MIKMVLIRQNIHPGNRRTKKLFSEEYQRVMHELFTIECEFYTMLFSDSQLSYNEIYILHLNKFTRACKKINNPAPMFAAANESFFSEMFKPVVK